MRSAWRFRASQTMKPKPFSAWKVLILPTS